MPILRPRGPVLSGLLAAASVALACVSQPRRPAQGTPLTCPEVRLPPGPFQGSNSPDAARCSYDDALGASVVRITGKVMLEQEVGPGIGVGEVNLEIRRLRGATTANPEISSWRAQTDAQGGYRVSGAFGPGDYVITVYDTSGAAIARRRFELTKEMRGELEGMTVWIPLDERLREGGGSPVTAPPPPGAEARGPATPPSTPPTTPQVREGPQVSGDMSQETSEKSTPEST